MAAKKIDQIGPHDSDIFIIKTTDYKRPMNAQPNKNPNVLGLNQHPAAEYKGLTILSLAAAKLFEHCGVALQANILPPCVRIL